MLFQDALHDLRYAFRQFGKNPGFFALAVGTLALGIAATSTMFSWIDSTLLDPIPGVAHTADMITLMRGDRSEHPTPPFSYPDYVDLRDHAHSFSGMLAYHDDYMAITGSGRPERIYGALTSANYFEVLGVHPVLGSTLLSSQTNEHAGIAEIVLSYDLWQNRFAGDPSVLGKTIQLNLHPYTIVGVAPRGFQGAKPGLRADVWIPLGMVSKIWGSDWMDSRGISWLQVLGKLSPGVNQRQAVSELNVLMQRIVDRYPLDHQGSNAISADPLWRSPFGINVYLYGTLPILLALAAVLLLLACANVANLLLVRSVSRRRELAIRLSMGAGKWRIVRQLLLENLLIALASGVVAVIVTAWTARFLAALVPANSLPLTHNSREDATAVLATFLVCIFSAAVSGVVPALRASRLSPISILKDEALNTSGGLSKSRLTSGLVVAQISLSLMLLACAGLFAHSLQNAQNTDPGFDPNHVLLTSFDLTPMGLSDERAMEFDRQLLARVKALPGVDSATIADFSPLSFTMHSEGVRPEGYEPKLHETMEADRAKVSPGYLATLRTPLLSGRDFTDQDNESAAPVAVVNKAFVDRYWPGQNAIGKSIEVSKRSFTVVGVAANGKYRRMVYDPAPLVLLPVLQSFESNQILHVRVNGDPMALASSVEQGIHDLNPDLPVFNVATLQASMRIGSVFERIALTMAGAFGLLALLLAVVGIYAVIAYSTRQRTHEIGIRMALGAQRSDVFIGVIGQGIRLCLIGLAAGLTLSLIFTRILRGMLFGVGTADWLTFASVAIVLFLAALAACYLPARRAASVDPMQALRAE